MKFISAALTLLAAVACAQDTQTRAVQKRDAAYSTLTTTILIVQPPAPSQTTNTEPSTSTIRLTVTVDPTTDTKQVVTTTVVVTQPLQSSQTTPEKSTVSLTITVNPPSTSVVTQTITLLPPLLATTEWVTVTKSSTTTTSTPEPTGVTITKTVTIETTSASVTTTVSTLNPTDLYATYVKSRCSTIQCASNEEYILENGKNKECYNVYYDGKLGYSTCVSYNCCQKKKTQETVKVTTCKNENVRCNNRQVAAADQNGNSAPCFITYKSGEQNSWNILRSTCKRKSCCVLKVQTMTLTSLVTVTSTQKQTVTSVVKPTGSSRLESCKTYVKCRVYRKEPYTTWTKKCIPAGGVRSCSVKNCCLKK